MRRTHPVTVQNILMSTADREIALSTLYMDSSEKRYLLSFLSSGKKNRIESEITLQEHLRIRYDYYTKAVEKLINRFSHGGRQDSMRTYLRPKR